MLCFSLGPLDVALVVCPLGFGYLWLRSSGRRFVSGPTQGAAPAPKVYTWLNQADPTSGERRNN